MKTAAVKVPEDWIDTLDKLADEHGTSRAAVLRSVIDNGLRAHKYHPDDFGIEPERFEEHDAVELTQRDDLDP
jgi:hypothetical protein